MNTSLKNFETHHRAWTKKSCVQSFLLSFFGGFQRSTSRRFLPSVAPPAQNSDQVWDFFRNDQYIPRGKCDHEIWGFKSNLEVKKFKTFPFFINASMSLLISVKCFLCFSAILLPPFVPCQRLQRVKSFDITDTDY